MKNNTYQTHVETIVLYVHEQSEILELSFNKNKACKPPIAHQCFLYL